MNKYIVICAFISILIASAKAQISIDSVLAGIERNNMTIQVLKKTLEAEKLRNHTGVYLQNPEINVNYLWGNTQTSGNRTDISIRQSFDFPTAYSYRRQIADSRDQQSELEFAKQRKSIMQNASLLCADIIYANSIINENSRRLNHAQEIADAYQSMYEKGEVSILDHNKAQLNLLNRKKELESLLLDRITLLKQLEAMNGGYEIASTEYLIQARVLPPNFEDWYLKAEQNNMALQWLKKEIEITQHQAGLNKALLLPKASTGYLSEKISDEHLQGITVGISLPLWEHKNSVKYAQVQTFALQSLEIESKRQYYLQLKSQFEKASSLQNTTQEYRHLIESSDQPVLLRKALDQGEITLISYLTELSFTYEAIDKLLKTEYELNKLIVLLSHYEMP